jgi:tetratricopeptide (TPR) repeat protein
MMTNTPSPQEIADQAKLAYQAGDFMQSAQAFSEAASAYTGAGDALMSAEMKNNQSVALLLAGEAQAALQAVEGTQSIFANAGDFRRQGMAFANQASALEALKRFKDAMDYYKEAAAALEKANEGDMRADVMQSLSMLYMRRFKLYDAVITLQAGLAGVKNPTLKQRIMKKILFVRL